jgi:NADH:ubiquinone oxidoreductase subunit 6 (subunit J)
MSDPLRTTSAAVLATLAVVFGLPLILTASAIWSGYVLTHLWVWFVVPLFGLPALSLAGAIGVTLVVSFMTFQYQRNNKDDMTPGRRFGEVIGWITLRPLLALTVGWVVKQWM